MGKWSNLEIKHAVDYERLVRKIENVDLNQLINTTETLLWELIDNPKVRVENAVGELQHLESIRTASTGDLVRYDHHLVVLAFRKLAKIIITRHFVELSCFKNDKGRFPIENVVIALRDGDLTLEIRSSGVHGLTIPLDAYNRLHDAVYKTITPELMGSGWRSLLPVSKIMLDLFSMDNYELDTIRAYADSQHDWAISSASGVLSSQRNWYSYGVTRKYDQFFVSAVTTSLMYGCGKVDSEAGIKMLGPLGPSNARGKGFTWTDDLNVMNTVRSVSSVIVDESGLYDKGFVEFVLTYNLSSRMRRSYPFEDVKRSFGGYNNKSAIHFCAIDDAKARYYRRFTSMKSIGNVMVDSIGFPNLYTSKGECRVSGFPTPLKSKITKDYLKDLESRTRFIHGFLVDNCLPTSMMMNGVYDGRPVTAEDVHEMMWHYDYNMESRHYVLPFMVYPPNKGEALLDYRWPVKYMPEANGDYDDVDRFHAFVKMYVLHQMVRVPEIIPDDDAKVTPFDVVVMTDVLEAINRVNDRLLMDGESKWFRGLTDRCLDVLRRSVAERQISKDDTLDTLTLADDTSCLYAMMLDGDARDLEEAFKRVDDVLIDALIDYYVGYELGGSPLPVDFFMENLQMDTMDGYESAVRECLDLEPAHRVDPVLV